MGKFGDDLEANIGALFRPEQSDGAKFETAIDLAMKIGEEIPFLGLAVKLVAWREAWFADDKKAGRVTDVLLGLYDRIAKLEAAAKEHLRTDQPEAMRAIVEETLARIAEQTDDRRREDMQRILYKILEKPRDLTENRMFVRLADELPLPALKILTALHSPVVPMQSTKNGLGRHADLQDYDMTFWLKFLGGQGLINEDELGNVQHGTYEALQTPIAREFEAYRRG